MSNAGAPEEGSIPNAVIIPTTVGPISIRHLFRQVDASVEMPSSALLGLTTTPADIAKSYDRFVRRPTGLVHRLFGETDPKPYLLFVSANINAGESWQLPVMLAHALEHAGQPIVQEPSATKRLIWATGTLSAVDYAIGGVDHVSDKLRFSKGLLEEALGVAKVEIFVPAEDRAAIEPDVAEWLSALGLQINFVRTLDECLTALGLRKIPKAASRPSAAESRWKGNPYRGLETFTHEHRAIFFGRAKAREEALELLQTAYARGQPFLLVHGPSGVGKSSFVQAGLAGDLQERCGPAGRFRFVRINPAGSTSPMAALGGALETLLGSPDAAPTSQIASPTFLSEDVIGRLQSASVNGDTHLLIVDQLEEIFDPSVAETERLLFADALERIVRSRAIWVVATMRSDALGLIDRAPALARLSRDERMYRLARPTRRELTEIVTSPAALVGYPFPDQLVFDELVDLAVASPDSLPLLQAVLFRLFEQVDDGKRFTAKALVRLGGFEGVVGRWADEAVEKLLAEGLAGEVIDRLLISLVRLDRESGRPHARTVSYNPHSPEGRILKELADCRLVGLSEGREGSRARLAHEVLATHWELLTSLLNRLGPGMAQRDELEQAAAAWIAAERNKGWLLQSSAPLERAEAFLRDGAVSAAETTIEFVKASRRAKQRVYRSRLARILAVLAITAAAAAWWWDQNLRISYQYCSTIGERWGVPYCIDQIDVTSAEKRHIVYRLELQGGAVRQMARLNGSAAPSEAYETPFEGESWTYSIARWTYHYAEDTSRGHVLAGITATRSNGAAARKFLFSFSDDHRWAVVRFDKGLGVAERQSALGGALGAQPKRKRNRTVIGQHRLAFDEYGRLIKRIFEPVGGGASVPDGSGAYGEAYAYDSAGALQEVLSLDGRGEPLVEKSGVLVKHYGYDREKRLVQIAWLNGRGEPIANDLLVARVEIKRDEAGNVRELAYLDGRDQLALHKQERIARATFRYDERGNKVEEAFFGVDGQPALRKDIGVARIIRRCNEHGNSIEEVYFGVHGEAVMQRELMVARVTWRYDEHGNKIEETYSGADGQPTLRNLLKVARATFRYDEHGNKIEEAYFGEDSQPASRQDLGVARAAFRYDELGNIIEAAYFGVDGQPVPRIDLGVTRIAWRYDVSGNIIEAAYFGSNNKPTSSTDKGVARISWRYDEHGNILEEAYFGSDSHPTLHQRLGMARVTWSYDERGNKIEEAYFGLDGQPIGNKGLREVTRVTWSYDERGNLIEEAYFGPDGRPAQGIGGVARATWYYDGHGNLIGEAYFGPDGTTVKCSYFCQVYFAQRVLQSNPQ